MSIMGQKLKKCVCGGGGDLAALALKPANVKIDWVKHDDLELEG